jgi:uncharacterized protein
MGITRPRLRRMLVWACALLAAWLGAGWISAWLICSPRRCDVPEIETLAGHAVREVRIDTSDGLTLVADFVERRPDRCVILLHGIRANRTQCRGRGAIYAGRGDSVLMPDFRAHGQSGGDTISLGWHERLDLEACCAWLRTRGFERIAVHGISLGAATILYSLDGHPEYDFAVLESPYDTIENALDNRMPRVPWPRFVLWPMGFFVERRLGVEASELRPIDRVGTLGVPVLLLAGAEDRLVLPGESRAIFDRCGSPLKTLHVFAGAGHVDFLVHAPSGYGEVLGGFLGRLPR